MSLFHLLASVLAFFYELVPSYAFAIAALTFAVMLVLSPLTLKSTRNMLEMQRLQPEMKKLQQQYKNDRQKLNEEMMALYREHRVNPVAGCIPMLLQMPVFIVMYQVIAGLTRRTRDGVPSPKYLSEDTELYKALVEGGGKMTSFGIDLAKAANDSHPSLAAAFPFFALVALVIVTQYLQTKQMTARNPASAQANPQTQMMTRVMPIFFGFISYSIKAGVNVYFLASAVFRIAQQEAMYRWDPHVVRNAEAARESRAKDGGGDGAGGAGGGKGKGGGKNGGGKAIETNAKDVTKNGGSGAGSGAGNGKVNRPVNKAANKNKKKKR